ncbi:histidine kinase [Roseateles sp. GG27B]
MPNLPNMPKARSLLGSPSVGRWLLRQALLILAITAVISTGLVVMFDQHSAPTVIYTLCISACCFISVRGLSMLLGAWVNRGKLPPDQVWPTWPGWPLMIVSLIVGTVLGYSLGNELANWVTGFNEPGLRDSSWRRGLTLMMVSLIPGIGMTMFFVHRGRLAAAELKVQAAQRQAAENQLRLLASQLEPQMLFNTLANLRVLIGMDPARAQAMLDQLIAFLRATLNASRSSQHSLTDEFARLGDYLALMQIRMGARLRPVLDLPPSWRRCRSPHCCCSRWWKTRSSMGWSRRLTAASCASARGWWPGSWCWKWPTVASD